MKNINVKVQFIKKNFLLFFSAFIIPTIILGIFLVYRSYDNTSREIIKRLENSLTLAVENLDIITGESRAMNLYMENSNQMLNLNRMMNSEVISYSEMVSLNYLSSFVESLFNAKSYINSIYLYIDNPLGRVYHSDTNLTLKKNITDQEWISRLLENPKGKSWIEIRDIKNYSFEKPHKVLTIYNKFNNYNGGTVINYNMSHINKLFHSMVFYENQMIFVTDGNKMLIQSTDETPEQLDELIEKLNDESFQNINISNSSYFVLKASYKAGDMHIMTVLPKSTLYTVALDNAKNTVSILILIIVITVFLAYIISVNNYKHLHQVIDIFENAKSSPDYLQIENKNKDLYTQILNNIIKIFVENNYLQLQLSERKFKLKVLEMQALQYQINPHFLFNTLQTINYEIFSLSAGTHTPANRMVENLSDILRFSLESPDLKVKIRYEIENCKKYVEIERIRMDNHFSVEWDVDPSIIENKVIRLILQPLIENAIKHGIKPMVRPGTIRVKIQKADLLIRFDISDNGSGIEAHRLEAIQEAMNSLAREETGEHIGLTNCSRRLALAYAKDNPIHIQSEAGIGTMITFFIPIESDEQ